MSIIDKIQSFDMGGWWLAFIFIAVMSTAALLLGMSWRLIVKNPIVIATIIISLTIIVAVLIVMYPVYTCLYENRATPAICLR